MTDVLLLTLIVTGLILANAFFVAAEFALISVSRPRIERMAARRHPLAMKIRELVTSAPAQDRFLATSQLGLSLVSLGLGMYGEHTMTLMLIPWLSGLRVLEHAPDPMAMAHAIATGSVLLFLTFWHIVLGEMVPKSLALARPERVIFASILPMRATFVLFYPVIVLLNLLGNLVLRLLRLPVSADMSFVYTPSELRTIMGESADEGLLAQHDERLLRRVIDFEHRHARQVMVNRTRVVGFPAEMRVAEAVPMAAAEAFTRYPVYERDVDHVVGMVHVRDLLCHLREGRGDAILRDLARRVLFVPESMSTSDLFERLQKEKTHMAVVLDERGGTAGIVTLEDLIEEIFGEVRDEFDAEEEPPIVALPDGSLRVQGDVTLTTLQESLELEVTSEDVDTVNGLVTLLLGRPPRVGDGVDSGAIHVDVEQVRGRAVGRARICRRTCADEPATPPARI